MILKILFCIFVGMVFGAFEALLIYIFLDGGENNG